MNTFGFRRELNKYEELDEDELLASLTAEELQELEKELSDIDSDDKKKMIRKSDRTVKTPTGTFSREALLNYWQKETFQTLKNERIGSSFPQLGDSNNKEIAKETNRMETDLEGEKKKDEEKDKEDCIDIEVINEESEIEEPVTEEEEKKKGKEEDEEEEKEGDKEFDGKNVNSLYMDSAPEKCVSQNNMYNGRLSHKIADSVKRNLPQESNQLSENPTVIDEVLENIFNDNPNTTEVNLNNIDNISQETLINFADALRSNTHVQSFSLANTRADDPVAFAIAKMLRENCHIVKINIESNYITGKGILALAQALRHNKTITELRFHNQRHICGGQVEMEIVHLLRENTTLLRLGYQFDLPGPRMSMTGILTRNQDLLRQKRMQELQQQRCVLTPINPHTNALQKNTPTSSPCGSPLSSPWSSPKLLCNKIIKRNSQPSFPPPPPPPPLPPPPLSKPQVITEKKSPSRNIAEVIKLQEACAKNQQAHGKDKSKKVDNGVPKEDGTEHILKETKNTLRPITDRESSRPSTPIRSAHDELMAAIRSSSIKSLKRVEVPKHLG